MKRLIVLTALPLIAACASRPPADFAEPYTANYRDRHPVVVDQHETSVVVRATSHSGLAADDRARVANFLADFRASRATTFTLAGATGSDAARDTVALVRQRGLASRMRVVPGATAQTVTLSFSSFDARVPHECGQWPDALGPDSIPRRGELTTQWLQNGSFYNFGCATQAAFAAQVDDPAEHLRPAAESEASAARRLDVLRKYRLGRDPSTEYRSSDTPDTTQGAR